MSTIRIANYGDTYHGWIRTTTDFAPTSEAGRVGNVRYVLGRRIGLDTRICDLHLRIDAGQVLEIDLANAVTEPFTLGPLPTDPVAHFGIPAIAGQPLSILSAKADGAAYLTHMRARTGPMLCTDVWMWWYPDQPGWCRGVVIVTASNGSAPDMAATVPVGFDLDLGTADVVIPGLSGSVLLPQGETVADGMARSLPFTAVWASQLRGGDEWQSAGNFVQFQVCANGVKNLWPGGYPLPRAGVSSLGWTREHWQAEVARLHRWDFGPLGPVAAGGQTGAQEDQVFVGAECAGILGLGAETVRYFVALQQSRRPIHHLEADGSHLDLIQHLNLVTWSGRAHWHPVVSPDQLGKPRLQNDEAHPNETHGITGQDRQHWFLNTLACAARLTGCPALQWQLEHHARLFLAQETIRPGWATSHVDSAREIGWAGLVVVHLWRNLENRELAEQVAERWRQRVLMVYIPECANRVAAIWCPIQDDRVRNEIGPGWDWGWLPDHQSVGALGLDLACELVGPPEGRAMALAGAKAVLDRAFTRDGDRWLEWERLGFLESDIVAPREGQGAHRTGWFLSAWFPFATATVLRHEPSNEKALSIWRQQLSDGNGGGSWFLPGMVH